MPLNEQAKAAAAIHRKLRALRAVFLDPAATGPERANAEGLKQRLEKQLAPEAPPAPPAPPEGKLTGLMFRLGQGVKEIASPPAPKGDWTDHAFRLGRMFRTVARGSGQHKK